MSMDVKSYIRIAPGFQKSVNLAYDLNNMGKIEDFIPSTSALEIIEPIILSTHPSSTDRAHILIGPYGKGKSHIVLMLLAMMRERENLPAFERVWEAIEEYSPDLYSYVYEYMHSPEKLLPVIIQGSSTSLNQSFLYAIQLALKDAGLEDLMPDTHFVAANNKLQMWEKDFPETYTRFVESISPTPIEEFRARLSEFDASAYEAFVEIYPRLTSGGEFNPFLGFDVVELYSTIASALKDRGYQGLFVVYDEFSKYLEANIRGTSISDIKMLQDFAEKCNRSKTDQMHLLLIAHKDIENYIDRLPKNKVDGWRGVSERFTHLEMHTNYGQLYEIMATAIGKTEAFREEYCAAHEDYFSWASKFVEGVSLFNDLAPELRDYVVYGGYPLHPTTLFLLPRLSELVAQNERTLFTFISAHNRHTLVDNLDHGTQSVLTPDAIYDYFEPLLKKEVYTSDIFKMYSLSNRILAKIDRKSLEAKVVKTLALIYIVNQFEKFPPLADKVIASFAGAFSETDVSTAIKNLEEREYVIYAKKSNNYLRLKEATEADDLDPDTRVAELTSCYKSELCIAEDKDTQSETIEEKLKQARLFFDGEQLCLKYSRARYDSVLRDALCIVYLKRKTDTNNFELSTLLNLDEDAFTSNYISALQTIFSRIWDYACEAIGPSTATLWDKTEKAIQCADEIIKNMSLCIVLTENESDANKLFEVLNDRSLDVEDLELIKNHFYKEYCTKSKDSDEDKDQRISQLDELWADKVFTGNGEMKNRLISYLSAVYLTSDKELGYKDDAKLKDAIEKGYSTRFYPSGGKEYRYEDILADFNTYFAVKIILDRFKIRVKKLPEACLSAEQERVSITYKALHLLNALKYHAVIPAITNVIISTYAQKHSLTDPNFEVTFKGFVDNIINDVNCENKELEKIHKCSYILWVASIKGKDFSIPRSIAKRIIEKYGHFPYSNDSMDFLGDEISRLDEEFDEWLSGWTYSSSKNFIIKVLFLNLLVCERDPKTGGYKENSVTIDTRSGLTYKLDAAKLQLDHLEANNLDPAAPEKYYMANDVENRAKDLNVYLGNFMILDAADNNQKKNVPLCSALGFYTKIDKSWLIEDIKEMMSDDDYFDVANNVPKKEFFVTRTKQLKKYFKAIVNRKIDQTKVTVSLI